MNPKYASSKSLFRETFPGREVSEFEGFRLKAMRIQANLGTRMIKLAEFDIIRQGMNLKPKNSASLSLYIQTIFVLEKFQGRTQAHMFQ